MSGASWPPGLGTQSTHHVPEKEIIVQYDIIPLVLVEMQNKLEDSSRIYRDFRSVLLNRIK
jgi:hypothetical protein